MKIILVLSAVSVNLVAAVQFVNGPNGWAHALNFNPREQPWEDARIDKRAVQPPSVQELPNRNPHMPEAKTVKIRYGPYTVPGASVPGGEGMISNRPNPSVTKPCTSCMILGMNAGLEYLDGQDANTDTLMWLHHMVMFNIGKGAWDATCTIFGAPHFIVGSWPTSSERIFSSGNERTTTFFNPPWANVTNLGYPVYPQDKFGMIVDLMNMNTEAKPVYLTIYYDFIDGHPPNFEEVKPVWLDAFQCGSSEISGRGPNSKFDFGSLPWKTNFEGEIMGAGGHLHDGGTKLDLVVDGQVICSSVPTYGSDQEARERADASKKGVVAKLNEPTTRFVKDGMDSSSRADLALPGQKAPSSGRELARRDDPSESHGGHAAPGTSQHIIAMTICADNKAGIKNLPLSPLLLHDLKKGQSWTLRAYYDYNEHAGMKNHNTGGMSSVMGIAIMYAKTKVKRRV